MSALTIRHVGIHVRDLDEELAFLEVLGAAVTSVDTLPRGRVAFVSLDGIWHHSFAVFEDGQPLASGDSQKEPRGLDHIAMSTGSRADVDAWKAKLTDRGIPVQGPQIQGPEGGGLDGGSSSYTIFFRDPNGICFEIFADAQTVGAFHARRAGTAAA